MSEAFNPYTHLARAALGDAETQRKLAQAALHVGVEGADLIAFAEALVFARLVYASTGDPEDAGALIAMLGLACEFCPEENGACENWLGEGIAIASRLADEGVPSADQFLSKLVEVAGKAAAEAAKDITKLMNEEIA